MKEGMNNSFSGLFFREFSERTGVIPCRDSRAMESFLSKSQVSFFNENGYLVLEDFYDGDTVEELRNRMTSILNNFDYEASMAEAEAATEKASYIFTTNDQSRKSDDYFLSSGDKIRFFWEEKAWVDGKLIAEKEPTTAINKVGHALHDLDPVFMRHSYDERVVRICHDVGMAAPVAVQSMYIFKQAFIGGEVNAHQDGAFLYTRPQSVLGLWWALDDCTLENGCLWAVPGSHNLGVHRRFRRRPNGEPGTVFEPPEAVAWDLSQAVPLVIPRGSLVLLHSALVHFSKENSSSKARHAYSIHVIDGAEGVEYPRDNWLQRPADSQRPFMYMDKVRVPPPSAGPIGQVSLAQDGSAIYAPVLS